MGLAVGQIQLLSLTRRKADCERGISAIALRKMALTREMSQLTRDYQSKISQKQVVYYANGKYNKINYGYLMGYGNPIDNVEAILLGKKALKDNNKMILSDYQGRVVLANSYAQAIMDVCGVAQGAPFFQDDFPAIMEELTGGMFSEQEFANGIERYTWNAISTTPVSGESEETELDITDNINESIQKLIDFFYPMLRAAMVNGWTTEYNTEIQQNSDYMTDALATGTLILTEVNEYGYYDENASLTYFATSGDVELKSDADTRKELEVWYNAEKERISEKETFMDMELTDLSTELEAVKTEIESVKSFIDDATQSIFNWGNA